MSTEAPNTEIAQLEPQALWSNFAKLNAVPRASKQETQVTEFIRAFGESLNLETAVDATGNVRIRKPATAGRESRATVVLQSHLDMVHQKNATTEFDFATEGIRMEVDGDWVQAQGTTLGADNGIGVATIMTILASDQIPHPPLEALFTVDEETGMTGAKQLRSDWLTGKYLLNLDTEEDDELAIGCAGGMDVLARGRYAPEPVPAGSVARRISIRGLTGGHSGMDIHLGRANANKLMNRLIDRVAQACHARIAWIDGGGLRNAIPRESTAVLVLAADQVRVAESALDEESDLIAAEFRVTDPGLSIHVESTEAPASLLPAGAQSHLIAALFGVLSGISQMSPSIPDLVQTSNNLARVRIADGEMQIDCLTRGSVDSQRHQLAREIAVVLQTTGCQVEQTGDYPGWEPVPDSPLVGLMVDQYRELFGETPRVAACHAGLECGLIGEHFPGMEMISFGPTIRGAHSPDERVSISSVQKFWKYIQAVLDRIPPAN